MENKNLINKAIKFIQKNPRENLSLQSIAENAGFSLNYFDSVFKKHTGYSPVEYARVYKLTRSALELRRTERTVLDIALDFGYQSPESFSRAFKNFYSMTPAEYREKYSDQPVTWHDLSGRVAISHFEKLFPELKPSNTDAALDFLFTHNPQKYAEDIIGITVADTKTLTLGNTDSLEHFIYVSDYNSDEAFCDIVCEDEDSAIEYVKLLSKMPDPHFSIHKSVECSFDRFDAQIAALGLTCRHGYDMLYTKEEVTVPEYDGMSVRELTADDMELIRTFRQSGGCADCHVRACEIHFSGKGNTGMRPIGLFADGSDELALLAFPTLDEVRELRKYDIGAIFTLDGGKNEKAVELIWKYAIDMALRDNAVMGAGNAYEDAAEDPVGVVMAERMGLEKIAKKCRYFKK